MDDPVPDGCVVNDCSLREAVIAADQTVVKDIIVLLRDLTLQNAIYTTGEPIVNIDDCLFDNNSAGSGAAIYASFGVTVGNTVFQANKASNSRHCLPFRNNQRFTA